MADVISHHLTFSFFVLAVSAFLATGFWGYSQRLFLTSAAGLIGVCSLLLAIKNNGGQVSPIGDLFFYLPVLGAFAFIIGVVGAFRSVGATRASACALALVGGLFDSAIVHELWQISYGDTVSRQARQMGRKLYWEEAIRCESNSVERFGPLPGPDALCGGRMIVVKRSSDATPINQVVVNEQGRIFLLAGSGSGAEDEWPNEHVRFDR